MANRPYASIRERLLYAAFSWPSAELELQAWAGGNYNETHTHVSDLVAAGGVPSSKSLDPISCWVIAGGYAATDSVILPGNGFHVGEVISFLTLSDKGGAALDPALVLFIDDAATLPIVANGLDVVVTPDWLLHRGWWRP